MILESVIEHLRASCPPLAGRVAGAADFALGLRNYNENMALPAAYVVPLDQEAERNILLNGLQQTIHKTIGVIVEFDARPDRRGQVPAMSYDDMETVLFGSMLFWKDLPDPCRSNLGFYFAGGRFLDLDRARLFYQWEFAIDWQITDDDGWAPPSEPLETVEVDLFNGPDPPPGTSPAAVVWLPTGDDPPPPTNGPWPDEE